MSDEAVRLGQITKLFVNTLNSASRQAEIWQSNRAMDAAIMGRLSAVPMARWFTEKDINIEQAARAYVSTAAKSNALPVLVAYNIPGRDIGQDSSGGLPDSASYGQWISGLARGIGDLSAIVILEPDALAHLEQLPGSEQTVRLSILRMTIDTLRSTAPRSNVYIDAGHLG